MPTSRSTSAERSWIASVVSRACARIASANWASILFIGFRAFIALCMTTE